MHSLFRFLWKYYPFFLFVLLELIALQMVFSGGYQSTASSALYHVVGGAVHTRIDKVKSYFYLERDNALLMEDNNRLKAQVQALRTQMQNNSPFMLVDSLQTSESDSLLASVDSLSQTPQQPASFEFLPALVIHNETLHTRNYLMLNKGSADGVKENMGVINAQGLVGIVSDVSEHFSTVLSVLNTDANFSALVQPYGELCSLHWNAQDTEHAQLLHLERSAQLAIGDTVISSGFSYIFPRGIMIGYLSKIESNSNDFQVRPKLSVDFSRVHQVHIVRNIYYEELQALKERSVE